jgi:hypothetical protein
LAEGGIDKSYPDGLHESKCAEIELSMNQSLIFQSQSIECRQLGIGDNTLTASPLFVILVFCGFLCDEFLPKVLRHPSIIHKDGRIAIIQ